MNWRGNKGATFLRPLSLFFVTCLTALLLIGCGQNPTLTDQESGVYSRLHKKFSGMASYSATLRLTVKSNKTENVYTLKQKVKSPEQAVVTLIEPESLAGVTTVYSGGFVSVSSAEAEENMQLPASNTVNDLFLNEFFSQYYQSEDTSLSVNTSSDNAHNILLETVCIPDSAERHKISLLCDAKTLEPKVLTIYDVGGNIQTVAEFLDFSLDPNLDDSLFTLSNHAHLLENFK